ncbi:MAG: septal ring lytic transglycosylase RlpA family protein [Bacteroidota bacterium]
MQVFQDTGSNYIFMLKKIVSVISFVILSFSLQAQVDTAAAQNIDRMPADSFRTVRKALLGTAGTYSSKAEGTKTASGEIFSNKELTGACNAFPLGTWIKVTNRKNDRSVLVRINDRTSKKKTAPIIELSRSAVEKLGFLKTGTTKIKIQEVDTSSYLSNRNPDTLIKVEVIAPRKDTSITLNAFKPKGKPITGIASFYSANLDGTKTATGERYRNKKLTAASNNFKLNTWVEVTNLKNNKSVVVRINDRMHPRMKKRGRVVDMSGDAAAILDFKDAGLTKVKVQEIEFVKDTLVRQQGVDTLLAIKDSLTVKDSLLVHPDSTAANAVKDDNIVYGIASFYSSNLDGTKTSTGETYRNNKMSAASNHFKLNTWVRVTNLKNNNSVILRINDRMHPRMKAKGRVVDLSRLAASKLNFIKSGLVKVKVEVVEKGTLN